MRHKATVVTLGKAATAGPELVTVRARIATLSAVDSDNDTYDRGAFAGNNDVVISSWGHSSWRDDATALPIGRGAVFERDDSAEFAGVIVLGSESAKSHVELLRAMGSTQQWSFGYDVLAWRFETRGERRVRVIERLKVHEVSMVLRGAGVDTATLAVGGESMPDEDLVREYLRFVRASL